MTSTKKTAVGAPDSESRIRLQEATCEPSPTGRTLHAPIQNPHVMLSAYSTKQKIRLHFQADSPYTDQSFKDEADINTIMEKYQYNGELPVLNQAEPNFLDVTEMDFNNHMQAIAEAREMFAQLPSELRDRFGNNPAKFLGFANDPKNLPELAQLGLLTPEATLKVLKPEENS